MAATLLLACLGDPKHIRVVNGANNCSGRVEVLRNQQWGTVCDDGWDIHSAQVVCQGLGCGRAISALYKAHFGEGNGPIWLDDVKCKGTEASLKDCQLKGWANHNCYHGEDAGVVCSEVRLMDGINRCSGRVEVHWNEQWGTICDDGWDIHEAQVVCRELHCGNPSSALGGARYGPGSGTIWTGRVDGVGNETSLQECLRSPRKNQNCDHTGDVSVDCSDPKKIRLVNGPNRCSGRVEVFHRVQWGTVCDDEWNMESAQVVCRELGCGQAISAPGGAHFGEGSGRIWLDSVKCKGIEASLWNCAIESWGEHNCNHDEDAGVVCSG